MGSATVRRVITGLLTVGALLAGAGAIALAPDAARAAPAPVFTLDFGNLTPGSPESLSDTFFLERDAELTGFAWLERQGLMQNTALVVLVCDSGGTCANPEAELGAIFSRGTVEVTVTAEVAEAPTLAPTGSVVGQLTFVADDATSGGLPGTGSDVLIWLAIAAAVLAIGALLVAVVRPRGARVSREPPQ